MLTCRDGYCRIVGNVGNPVDLGNLAVQEIAHKERCRQTDATELFETTH
jgi:hypothetical protein